MKIGMGRMRVVGEMGTHGEVYYFTWGYGWGVYGFDLRRWVVDGLCGGSPASFYDGRCAIIGNDVTLSMEKESSYGQG